MSEYIEKAEKLSFPLIALDRIIAFPGEIVNCEVCSDVYGSDEAARETALGAGLAIAVPLTDSDSDFSDDALFDVGTVIKIKQLIKAADGGLRIVAEGFSRAIVLSTKKTEKYTTAEVICKTVALADDGGVKGDAYRRQMVSSVSKIVKISPSLSKEIMNSVRMIKNPAHMADFIASNILSKREDKLEILRIFNPYLRIEALLEILEYEITVLGYEASIHRKTQERINKSQRDYYLREEIKAIQDELGEGGGEADEYRAKILSLELDADTEKKLLKEAERLERSPFGSAEATVLSNYLDVCCELPWNKTTRDRTSVSAAKKILDTDHDGLYEVKNRLLEFLAVKQLNPELKGQILCLWGPPGVGKTSIAVSLAKAMKRKYVRVSLGGVRDEADIRGHRKTYVGAMPGRIVAAIQQAGVKNPLILLDEIDKMANDGRGDPASALLEVLDPEQNKYFRDHFVELPFDLSDCIFIATANTLDTVSRPLIDRMELIELHTYTKTEKISIAKNHLIPKQLKRHGLNRRSFRITDEALSEVIDCYTRESGVRNLEREIASLCRHAALDIIEKGVKSVSVDADKVSSFLGARKIIPERISPCDEVGAVNGLAYTQSGGDLLKIEVAVVDGNGKLELTGSLGDVMKESAKAALTCAKTLFPKYGIPSDICEKKDIHVHVPEGAIPKDGPSAGVTMLTAIISALSGIPVRRDIAMTGEITLRGNILAIGGLREKTMAAYAAGVSTVLIPTDNMKDIEKTDPLVRENITFIPCAKAEEALKNALAYENEERADRDPETKLFASVEVNGRIHSAL